MQATFEHDTFTATAGSYVASITVKQIERTWDALSHFPDRRARQELAQLAAALNYFGGKLDTLKAAGGALDVEAEGERFARRHVELTRRAWAMESRCASWFVVGPSNFPTTSNQKRQASRDKAYEARSAHMAAAFKAIERAAFPHGMPGGAIRSSHPDAPALIRAKIEKRRNLHALMKATNAAIRAAKTDDDAALIEAVQGATGFARATCAKVVQKDFAGRRGFQDYQLSGELAEIKRLEGRLQAIEAKRERGDVQSQHETSAGLVDLVENVAADRIQLMFRGKPADDVRAMLKAHGFRWAPSESAWQRHLNNAGRYAASRVLEKIGATEMPAASGWSADTAQQRVGGTFGS